MKKPHIIITLGDPNGIGPEVTKKALEDSEIKNLAEFILIEPKDKTGFEALKRAGDILKKEKGYYSLVTAPVNKAAINNAGIPFKGHTEYLAELTQAKKVVMMFYHKRLTPPLRARAGLKVSLVTRHLALKDVARFITREMVEDTILLTHSALKKYFNIKNPRIGVAGLNPHCGESGIMGMEEQNIIIPAIDIARRENPNIKGPIAGDAIFYMAYKGELDAVVAMYHDQGLAPFKMFAFDEGVNVTLGLPFIRTSPDHGTAYDIAGKGIANPNSMKEAIRLAVKMSGACT